MIDTLELTAIPPEDEALRVEVRSFLAETLDGLEPDERARSWMGFDAGFSRQLAERGWLGLTLPREHGGSARGHFARFVLSEELLGAGAPVSAHWIADRQSAPLILKYGTPAQQACYLPRICRAQAFFCIGMSEPGSGSDLASIRTRAQRSASGWLVNGSKIWTTNAHRSHYMIALVRTSGSAQDRHQGLSQLIIDLSLPGVTVRPIEDLAGDAHFSEVFFDNVELAEDALIGEEGAGWAQVNAELAFERSGPERLYSSMALLECWLAHCRGLDDNASNRETLGSLLTQMAVLRAMSLSVAGKLAAGRSPATEAALVKDLGTELEQAIPRLIGDALGRRPDQPAPLPLLRTLAYLEQVAPTFSLRGGTREILRGIIARGLGLR
ncbi:Acyl-CoA dehydrogenase fadE12 [Achromobacter insolitus]|uniref:acyl-CoA dehydrogenase family protein n=1 Tax=Achromobacter insolitus TaxID=217204 RepID=UPI000972786B|nr:acyl-CoA dehydrogenase family protein [Achromobacter insolitus]APX75403.1 acyl-CoA dehydrogenase [Achromobacter insolitus]OWT59565.1 acyl-CoA dehydrogenase [Achromobacter insolitus]CAB3700086.1 Putative acyl-CoA dehydrogenase FadE17 [Achromobacter insolitus]VEG67394.1 Acyl-CoA dehydrogenase fadE12 [Achromobacter insolitus]